MLTADVALPASHGRKRHWNIGGSQVERRRRENRGAVGGEGCVHLPGKFVNFSSQNDVIWCTLGAMQMKMTATCGIQKIH